MAYGCILPPSDEGGGCDKVADGGREKLNTNKIIGFSQNQSLPQSYGQLPRQREPKQIIT